MHRYRPALLAVVLALNAAVAGAQSSRQQVPVVAAGSRVRVLLSADEARRTGRGLVSGTLLSGDSALVVIMRKGASYADTIPTFTIDDVELYTGQRSRVQMIIAGAAAGAAASGLVYAIDRFSRAHRCSASKDCPPLLRPSDYAIPVAVGAVFGATFSASRWVRVPRQAVYLGVGGSPSLDLSATFRFR